MPCCVSLFEIYLSLCEHLNFLFLFSPFFSLNCQICYCFSLDKVEINIRIFKTTLPNILFLQYIGSHLESSPDSAVQLSSAEHFYIFPPQMAYEHWM